MSGNITQHATQHIRPHNLHAFLRPLKWPSLSKLFRSINCKFQSFLHYFLVVSVIIVVSSSSSLYPNNAYNLNDHIGCLSKEESHVLPPSLHLGATPVSSFLLQSYWMVSRCRSWHSASKDICFGSATFPPHRDLLLSHWSSSPKIIQCIRAIVYHVVPLLLGW